MYIHHFLGKYDENAKNPDSTGKAKKGATSR